MKKAKIAHIMTVNWNMEKLLMDKMTGLRNMGYGIELISSDGEYVEKIRREGFPYHTIHIARKISFFEDIVSIYKLYKLFKKDSFDIVHTHTAKAGFVGRIAAKFAGVPIIIHTVHGLPFYEGQSRIKNCLYKSLEKVAAMASDYIFSQNQEDYEKIINNKIKNSEKVYFEGNGVNIERLERIFTNVNPLVKKEELGVNMDVFIIGYFARFEPVKGHKTFIEAFEKLVKVYPNMICLMAGKGELEEEIQQLIEEKELDKNIILLGFRDDVIEILRVTNLVILASEKEGVPRILMESMALGVPVIATNVMGTKELVEHNESGLLVEYLDVEGLYKALKLMYEDPEKMKGLAEKGKKRIKNVFNEDVVVGRIHSKYQEILK